MLGDALGLDLEGNPPLAATPEVGFRVAVGGGMGRTPIIATEFNAFVPWQQILVYIEAIVRVYNLHGRRDNLYKARIKILVKAEGQRFVDDVNREFAALLADPATPLIPQAELDRVAACFTVPQHVNAPSSTPEGEPLPAYTRWLERNVHGHKLPGLRAVTLSLKRAGQAPGDVTDDQMEAAAALSEQYSLGELRVSHDQNLVLPWVRTADLPALFDREVSYSLIPIAEKVVIRLAPGRSYRLREVFGVSTASWTLAADGTLGSRLGDQGRTNLCRRRRSGNRAVPDVRARIHVVQRL